MPTVTVKIKLPDYNRQAFTDLLIAGQKNIPFRNEELLKEYSLDYPNIIKILKKVKQELNLEKVNVIGSCDHLILQIKK